MPDEAKTVRKSLISSLIRPDELNILHWTDVSDILETVKLQSFTVKTESDDFICSDITNAWFHFLNSQRL